MKIYKTRVNDQAFVLKLAKTYQLLQEKENLTVANV